MHLCQFHPDFLLIQFRQALLLEYLVECLHSLRLPNNSVRQEVHSLLRQAFLKDSSSEKYNTFTIHVY